MSARSFYPSVQVRRAWVDIRDHGAKIDGTTDDTAAWTASVAELGGNPGVLYCPGVSVCDPDVIVLSTGQMLRGDGPGRSRIVQRAGTSGTALVITAGFAGLTGTDTSAGTPHGFAVVGITVDGNKAATSGTPKGIALFGHSYVIRNVHVVAARTEGIWSEWATAGESDQGPMEAHVTDVKVVDCDGVGLRWDGPHDSVITQTEVARCAATSGDYGVWVGGDDTGKAVGTAMHAVHAWGEHSDYAIRIQAQSTRFTDCVAEGSQVAQVWLYASWIFWRGGHCYSADVNPASNIGLLVGAPGVEPAGLDIDTRVDSCGGGAIRYDYGGANRFAIQGTYYPEDTPDEPTLGVIGADRTSDTHRIVITDSADIPTAGSRLVQPGPVVINRTSSGDTRPLLLARTESGAALFTVTAVGDIVVGGATYLASAFVYERLAVQGINGLSQFSLCGRKATTGAPSTSTWSTGDVVLDSAGKWWLCTAGGTPGTWTGG